MMRFACGPALEFEVLATCGRARATRLHLPHGIVNTPVFMPVGTQVRLVHCGGPTTAVQDVCVAAWAGDDQGHHSG
jgi:hypothetical protein